jgi:putative DNA primase/helicase
LRAIAREDYVTPNKVLGVDYVPGVKSKLWEDTLDKIFCGSEEDKLYMQVVLGYSLTAEGKESIMPFLKGDGAEGKSFIMNVYQGVAGAHVAVMNIGTVCNLPAGEVAATNNLGEELSKMQSHRVLLYNEIQHCSFNANFLKITGNDAIAAREIFRKACTIATPRFCIGVTNQMPGLPKSFGPQNPVQNFKRRIRVLMLWGAFVEAGTDMDEYKAANPNRKAYYRQDPDLETEILTNHKEAVLAWLVEGAMMWYKAGSIGAVEPDSVRLATKEYFDAAKPIDMLQQFIDSGCDVGEDKRVTTSALYRAYVSFRRRYELPLITINEFNKAMDAKGFKKTDSMRFKREEMNNWNEITEKASVVTTGFRGITLAE